MLVSLLVVAAGFHLWGVAFGWRNATLQGNEFRETHTAVSAYYIQHDRDFSLAYPTPVMGKPWSIPMEFPLYQWTVVLLSDTTSLPLQESGRLVSMLCFYLSVPALYLLLRSIGLRPVFCLIPLSLILTCPLYVLFARAFLIETMALMFGLWYLVALVRGSGERKGWWLILINLAGIGSGLVKVTTFLVCLALAALWSLTLLWRSWPRADRPGWNPFLRLLGWLATAHALPFAFTLWWIRFADAVKTLNPTGYNLRSDQLLHWNFGLGDRFSPINWRLIWKTFSEQVVWTPGLILAAVVGLFLVRRRGKMIALLVGVYVATLTVFPVLYAAHAYYHIAAAYLPLTALGMVVICACESSRLPRFAGPALLAVLLTGQIWAYAKYSYPLYKSGGNRGTLATVLNDVLSSKECLIIAGDDWSPILPYYSERRALLIRASLSHNPEYLQAAFSAMRGEDIGALVLFDQERDNRTLLEFAVRELGIDPEPLMFCNDRQRNAVVYFNRWLVSDAIAVFHKNVSHYYELRLANRPAPSDPLAGKELDYNALPQRYRDSFAGITPHPARVYSTFGFVRWKSNSEVWRLGTHPEFRLWFDLPPGRHRLHTSISIAPAAWENLIPADATDGVEITATATFTDGRREVLHQRRLNPALLPDDRGVLPIDWSFDLGPGARLELSVTPGPAGSIQRDWASVGDVEIE